MKLTTHFKKLCPVKEVYERLYEDSVGVFKFRTCAIPRETGTNEMRRECWRTGCRETHHAYTNTPLTVAAWGNAWKFSMTSAVCCSPLTWLLQRCQETFVKRLTWQTVLDFPRQFFVCFGLTSVLDLSWIWHFDLWVEIAGDSFVVKLLKHIKPQDRLFRYHCEAEKIPHICCQTRSSTFRTTWNLRECISDCNWRAFTFGLLCRRPVLTCKICGHLIYAGISDDHFTEKVLKFSSVSRRNIVISRKSSVNEVVMNSFIFKRFSYADLLRTYNEKLHEYKHTLCPQKRPPEHV